MRLKSVLNRFADSFILLGFPTYLGFDDLSKPPYVILEYIEGYKKGLAKYSPCPLCYDKGNLTESRNLCNPCQDGVLKPRDVQRIGPDLDVLVILNNTEGLTYINQYLADHGFFSFDYNHAASMSLLLEILAEERRNPYKSLNCGYYFPLDLHATRLPDFYYFLENWRYGSSESYELSVTSFYGHRLQRKKLTLGPNTFATAYVLSEIFLAKIKGILNSFNKQELIENIFRNPLFKAWKESDEYFERRIKERIEEMIRI